MSEEKNVLVVDDEPIVTMSCERVLSDQGYRVRTADSGKTGLDLARQRGYDVILADLKLPDFDGMEIVRIIRSEQPSIPVVIITGYSTPETKHEARQLGVAGYVEKPFVPGEISDAVLQALACTESGTGAIDAVAGEVAMLAARYGGADTALIQILLDIQEAHGYLPKAYLYGLARELTMPLNRVFKAATFYKAFSLEPRGKHLVQVCTGTACHVRGAPTLAERVGGLLHVRPGKTTHDGQFSLETVNCLGCCALGPVLAVDGKYYSDPAREELEAIFDGCRQEGE